MKPKIHIYTPNNLIKQKISENVSCCSPKSLSNLRNQSKEYLLKSNLNKTSKIRLHTEYMELGETSFIREIKDKGNSYSNYSKNFKNMVLDQEGNYLYTKINQEKNEKIEKTSNYSFNAKKQQMIKNYSKGKEYINLIDEKIKSLDEDDKNISNSSNKKITYQNFIDSIKIKKYNCLFSDLLNKSKQEIINNFQLQIESLIKEYSLNIEKLSKEK